MRYVIVRANENQQHSFGKFHDSLEDAKEEATRLCVKENCEFIILAEVGRIKMQSNPVVYEEII